MAIGDYLTSAIKEGSTIRTLRNGDVLFERNTPTVGVYEVLDGRVRMSRIDPVGHEVVLFVAKTGDTLAETTIFGQIYHCDAIAVTDATVRLYPQSLLLSEYEQNRAFAKAYTTMLARQLVNARARIEQRNLHSARDRIRHFLSMNMNAQKLSVEIKGTLKELALELGLTHEALYRALARMVENGEIQRQGSRITMLGQAVARTPDRHDD